jgi:alpha-tubulin suppressor-like RCC1 family protein
VWRTIGWLNAGLLAAGGLVADWTQARSASLPALGIHRVDEATVSLSWTNSRPGLRLLRSSSLAPPVLWEGIPETPQALGNLLVLTQAVSGDARFFRLFDPFAPPERFRPGALAASESHFLFARSDGTVWAWGANDVGQLGNGQALGSPLPLQVPGISNAVAVASWSDFSLVLTCDGTVWGWGRNWIGQLGTDTFYSTNLPVAVPGLSNIIAIAAGYAHAMALAAEGTVWTWGYNSAGQLGDGSTTDRVQAARVEGVSNVVAIAAGPDNSFAITTEGVIWSWGRNGNGQLGDGSTENRPVPAPVPGITNAVAVSAGSYHTLALMRDGTVLAWGANWDGRLGDGTGISSPTPVVVSNLTGVVAVACGGGHSMALDVRGVVHAWGDNRDGQLGDGTSTSRLAPVPSADMTNVIALAAGQASSAALTADGTIYTWGRHAYKNQYTRLYRRSPLATFVNDTMDTDHDGLPDSFETALGSSSTDADSDYDGANDYQELLNGTDPADADSVSAFRLAWFRFDDTNALGQAGQAPQFRTNAPVVPSWSGSALRVGTNAPAWLAYREEETNATSNINLRRGTVSFWFKPDWASVSAGGAGPGTNAALLAVGHRSESFTNEFWGLEVDAAGDRLRFLTEGEGQQRLYLDLPASFPSNQWHHIALTYSPTLSELYIDGQLAGTGAGVAAYPSRETRRRLGFNLGSDARGEAQSLGQFEELETFNHPRSASDIASDFNKALYPPTLRARFPGAFTRTNQVALTVSGLPVAIMAVLINATNFDAPVWVTNYAHPFIEVPVNLAAGDGVYRFSIGFLAGGQIYWQTRKIVLDTTPPAVFPGGQSFVTNSSLLQFVAHSVEPLKSITFDFSNNDVTNLNQRGFVLRAESDPATGEGATNWFQCFDLRLATGANRLSLRCEDLAGNVSTNEYHYTLDTAAMPAPAVVVDWPPDNAVLGGATFTLNGRINDPGATVSAQVTQGGSTREYHGIVERTGRFWIDRVPLSNSSAAVSVTVSNAAGQSASAALTVQRSPVSIQIDPLDPAVLTNATLTLRGSLNATGYVVTVNGTNASSWVDTNGLTHWQADNVPVPSGGVASFDVQAVPAPAGPGFAPASGDPEVQAQFSYDKPTHVRVSRYEEEVNINSHQHAYVIDCHNPEHIIFFDYYHDWILRRSRHWTNGMGGAARAIYATASDNYYFGGFEDPNPCLTEYQWPPENWPPTPLGREATTTTCERPLPFEPSLQVSLVNRMPIEHYEFGDNVVRPLDSCGGNYVFYRRAEARLELVVGGRAAVSGPVPMVLTARAFEPSDPLVTLYSDESSFLLDWHGQLHEFSSDIPVPPEAITIHGQPLFDASSSDGRWGAIYGLVPAGATLDVTPVVETTEHDCYTFEVKASAITIESNDRLVHGVIQGGNEDISLILDGPALPGAFGPYTGLFSDLRRVPPDSGIIILPANCRIYSREEDILSGDELDGIEAGTDLFAQQPVLFLRDAADPSVLHFYVVAEHYADLRVQLIVGGRVFPFTNAIRPGVLGDFINFTDRRIDSPAVDPVPVAPSAPPPIRQRSLLAKSLYTYLKNQVNPPLALGRGLIDGVWGGMKSDYEGLAGVSALVGRFTASAAERAAVIKELKSITWSGIGTSIANGLTQFMSQAEKNAVVFTFGQKDFTDQYLVYIYVDGYAMGFTVEQLVTIAVGAGAVSKVGLATKTALAATRTGQTVLQGVSAVTRFKARAVGLVINAAKNNPLTEQVATAARSMADRVASLPTQINGRTVGDIVSSSVERLDALYDELLRIGKPLDDFGVRAHEQLAKLLERDLGFFPGEKALRGNVRLYEKLVLEMGGDRYEDFLQLFRRADGTLNKDSLRSTLEAAKDEFDRAVTAGERPRILVKNYEQVHSDLYHHFSAGNAWRLQIRDGKVYLTEYSGDRGWYVTPEKFDTQQEAFEKLQLFNPEDGRYRARLRTPEVKENLKLPYGDGDRSPTTVEPLTRDDPGGNGGLGGARQLLLEHKEAEVFDVWDTLENRYLTQEEIMDLINEL